MYDKFIKLLDDPKLATAIASFLVVILTWLTRQIMKVPRLFKDQKNTRRNQQSVIDGAKRDNILYRLKRTGAIYIHLVRYHNGGGALKRGAPLKMSVDIEKLGSACDLCATTCRQGKAKPILHQWQNIQITGSWNVVVKNTVLHPGEINVVKMEDLDHEHKEIWEEVSIAEYREIFVKHKRTCFYTIGISFCPRFKNSNHSDGALSLAARQMANLL